MNLYKLYFLKDALKGHVIEKSTVNSLIECGLRCASLLPDCKPINYITKHPVQSAICEINNSSKSHAHKDDFVRQPNSEYFETIPNAENQQENQDVKQVLVVCVGVCVSVCVSCVCMCVPLSTCADYPYSCQLANHQLGPRYKYFSFFI